MAISGIALTIEEIEEKKAKILEHLAEGYGRTFYGACQVAQISAALGYRWRKESEAFEDAVEEARRLGAESAKDVAESVVMKVMATPDKEGAKMARWYLETKGKNRDYSKRSELTGAGGVPLGGGDELDPIRQRLIGRTVPQDPPDGAASDSGEPDAPAD